MTDNLDICVEKPSLGISNSQNPKSLNRNLQTILKVPLEKIEDILFQEFQHKKLPLLQSISQHIVDSGGKRIRPLLCLSIAELCGGISEPALTTAAALEFIHTATLLHDDVIDNGTSRRGKKSAHMIWGNQGAILSGDHMFASAFAMLANIEDFKVMQIMANAAKGLAEGEIMQLSLRHKVPSLSEHLDVIGHKTAELFAAGCACGAVFNKVSQKQIDSAYQFGYNFGISFQLIDDILDYQGNEALGKPIGSDFYEGKFTLPLILTYQAVADEDKNFIHHVMIKQKERSEEDFTQIKELITSCGAIKKAQDKAMSYLYQAEDNLNIFDTDHLIYNALTAMIADTIYRKI